MVPRIGGRTISRRGFLACVAPAGLGVAGAGIWLARQTNAPPSIPGAAEVAADVRARDLPSASRSSKHSYR
ncbi:MAG: hypothetical protein AUG06_04445 [Actinobacteria bacterium 13_1_20CM_2_65_11]|nr:MAG: hypothetical protein AUH40_02290 [Chloroflexi bacterium 13_1_40CM_65_17]OLD25943.1 MAG: hypothetical protein AUJ02_03485 [Chloroflexi bacterium 13_1_40CM_3_65_12]OLD50823.1 MAG: hypothetical protein AUI42_01590 [Actinobacteria bacterium 13_1_40CM_2_65_8]OLE80559.1 MAG: hypothetical protein AUG06_04445 [Actinobacteria bacterium 13_1_20CM_2_65_11]